MLIKMEKKTYCQYDPTLDFEGAQGGLRLFIPTKKGYVNYNLVHSVRADRNCDTWRLGKAYAFDDAFENEYELTPKGAEWDMAVKLSGRPDFIGGYAHGDEKYTSLSMWINGESVRAEELCARTPFEELRITVTSVGYDPADPKTAALKHEKRYTVTAVGITLEQRVEWLRGYTLASSYLAMMPPLKTLTDSFYTNVDPIPKEPTTNYGSVPGATGAVVYGKASGISFSMSVPRYPRLTGGSKFFMTDNHGNSYNKMYFVVCNGADVSAGDVWESETRHTITVGEVLSQ